MTVDRRYRFLTSWTQLHKALWVDPSHLEAAEFEESEAKYEEAIALLEQRDRFLEDWLNQQGSRPYSTFVVAAASSYAPGADVADYVCDGVADHVEISAAFAEVAASGFPGRVLLLEGDYYLDTGQVTVANAVLAGQGRNVTRLFVSGSGSVFGLGDAGAVEDLTVSILDDGVGWDVSTGTVAVRRVDFTTTGGV